MESKIRQSRVLRKLRNKETVSCFKINYSDPKIFDVAASFGFDCLWSDMEHVPSDWSSIEAAVYAAKSRDTDIVCRVSRGSYSDYIKPFELDAAGIMVPHIMGVEDARNVVQTCRFPPLGKRAVDGGNADGIYGCIPLAEYLRQSNMERFIILQIEDPEALKELDAIAALEGYDILLFGAGDFSVSIGVPGQLYHTEVNKARELVVKAARKHGKAAGAISFSPESYKELIEMGYNFINISSAVSVMRNGLKQISEAYKII